MTACRAMLAATLAAAVLGAQQPPQSRDALLQALRSRDAREVAWAAHFARGTNDKALAAPLVDALARWRTDETTAGRDVCAHLLHALLGIRAQVPADAALPLLDDGACGAAAFALLARAPQHNEAALLATFRRDLRETTLHEPPPPRARATASVLAAQRTPGLAALLAARVQRDLRVVVFDARSRRGAGWFMRPQPPRRPTAGWPPLPQYRFEDAPELAAGMEMQVAAGTWHPIELPGAAAGEVVHQLARPAAGEAMDMYSLPDTRRRRPTETDWLCTMAGVPVAFARLAHSFESPERYVATATAARDQRRAALRGLRDALVANGALTAEQAQPLDGPVAVDVRDERGDQTVALPSIPPAR